MLINLDRHKCNSMILRNNFTKETRVLFNQNTKCWFCGKNHNDCLHHIMGRVSSSPLNACPLSNFDCHIGNGRLATIKVRCKLLNKTLRYLISIDYSLTEEDIDFITKYQNIYEYD